MASESDQLRVKRRSAKGKFARQVRTVEAMVLNTRSHSEVYVNWETLQRLYDDLQNSHEKFCETIDPKDDPAYEEEEAWMETCRETYVKMSMSVNDYIRNMDSTKLCENDKPNGSDNDVKSHTTGNTATAGLGTAHQQSGMDKSPHEQLSNESESHRPTTFKLEFSQMPKFGGDVREYAVFRSDFKDLIEPKCSKRDAITLLRNNLSGKAHLLIKGMGNDYDAAWGYLDSVYGDPRVVADAVTYDITSFSALDDDDDSRFCELCHLVRRSYNTLKDIGRQADLDNNHMLAIIERKLSRDDRKVWSRKVEEGKSPATLEHLLNWMSIEMKTRMRASALIREEPSSVNHVHCVSSRENDHNGPRSYSEMSYRCWICMSSTHWIDECERFRSMTPTERVNTVNKNHACFCCLKRTGRNHTSNTCYRRRQCGERNGHEECKQYHHPLLHVVTNSSNVSCDAGLIGVAGMACDDVMLPVLGAYVLGENRTRKLANVLLDSGAQVSLIRIDLAEKLGLSGRNVTIAINKVGGEEQTLKTKRYKLNVQSTDSKHMVSMYAIGIPYITDDISSIINVNEKARELKIAVRDINRGGGPVDVLVGIDYPRLHTGETRMAGNVIARRSPLGWVIFGTDGQTSSSNRVLSVQIRTPVDFWDCKNDVSMGVVVEDRTVPRGEKNYIQEAYESCVKPLGGAVSTKVKNDNGYVMSRKSHSDESDRVPEIQTSTAVKIKKSQINDTCSGTADNRTSATSVVNTLDSCERHPQCKHVSSLLWLKEPDVYQEESPAAKAKLDNTDILPEAIEGQHKVLETQHTIDAGSKNSHKSWNTKVTTYNNARHATCERISKTSSLIELKLNDTEQLNRAECEPEVSVADELIGGIRSDELCGWWGKLVTFVMLALLTFILLLIHTSENNAVKIFNVIDSESLIHKQCMFVDCCKLTDKQWSGNTTVYGLLVYRNVGLLKNRIDDTDEWLVTYNVCEVRNYVEQYGKRNAKESCLENVLLKEDLTAVDRSIFTHDGCLIEVQNRPRKIRGRIQIAFIESGNSCYMVEFFRQINSMYGNIERRSLRSDNFGMLIQYTQIRWAWSGRPDVRTIYAGVNGNANKVIFEVKRFTA